MTTRPARRPHQMSLFEQETMTVDQAADYLRISRDTVTRMLSEGILRGYRHRPNGWWKVIKKSVLEHEQKLAEDADFLPSRSAK